MSAQPIPFDISAFFGRKYERVRLLRRNEVIPASLEAAFDILGQIDSEWVWVLEVDGKINGVLVASPCHGVAMIWRVVVAPGSSRMALRRLLTSFLRDCKKRGVRGYVTFMSTSGESQGRLARIIERAGGKAIQNNMTMYGSPMPRKHISQ